MITSCAVNFIVFQKWNVKDQDKALLFAKKKRKWYNVGMKAILVVIVGKNWKENVYEVKEKQYDY